MNPIFENVTALYFDAGSTLLEEMAIYEDRVRRTIEENKLAISFSSFLALLYEGAAKKENPYQYACAKLHIAHLVAWDFSKETLAPGALSLLQALQPHYALAMIANQPPHFEERLQKLGIRSYFRFVLGSQDVGITKPDPRLYRLALEKMGISAERSLMIGDRLENDIVPAKEVGFHTLWLRAGVSKAQEIESEKERPDATVSSLKEIESLLL
jgi:putative hydrolase of the HAD superfamily